MSQSFSQTPPAAAATARGTALVALQDAGATFGGRPLFAGLSIWVAKGERAGLVGRNGAGKSTLLKMLAGEVALDSGTRFVQPGARVAYLPQEPPMPPEVTAADWVAAGLAAAFDDAAGPDDWRVARALDDLGLDADAGLGTLSGGGRRRAALARALVTEPDVLLLDEPTNHLDLPTIGWLESRLAQFQGGLLLISHDRAFLTALTRRTYWLDRGRLHMTDRGFGAFETWSEELALEEAKLLERRDIRIAEEQRYMERGVTARRRRNMQRVRRLESLRADKRAHVGATGRVQAAIAEAEQSGRVVIEAEQIAKSFGDRVVLAPFSTRVQRGDRVGVIGPNGAGKTTLLKLLLGDLAPDSGKLKHGSGIVRATFDQDRSALASAPHPWGFLAGDGETVEVDGKPRHVMSYLRDFLFEDRQGKAAISGLSGGERGRLLLARLFARPSNLLVLDEPTNDLDMDTLDLLEDLVDGYGGTILLVSHDRSFLDRIATSVIVLDGSGQAEEFVGGYTDAARAAANGALAGALFRPSERLRAGAPRIAEAAAAAASAAGSGTTPQAGPKRPKAKLSFNDQRDLDTLPAKIDALAAQITAAEATLAAASAALGRLGKADPTAARAAITAATQEATRLRAELARAEDRWLVLEEKREALARG